MEVLLPLLFILLPFIFKLIGKKLEQAGNIEQAEKMRKIARTLGGNEDEESNAPKFFMEDNEDAEPDDDVKYDDDGNITEVFPKPVTYYMPTDRVAPFFTMTENVERQTAPTKAQAGKPKPKPILIEEDQKEREKIDPKKLVIYSEIMKPKYTD